jgi:hypothetical protein
MSEITWVNAEQGLFTIRSVPLTFPNRKQVVLCLGFTQRDKWSPRFFQFKLDCPNRLV